MTTRTYGGPLVDIAGAVDLDRALARAVRFGWDLRRPLAVLVARRCGTVGSDEPPPQQEASALRAAELWTWPSATGTGMRRWRVSPPNWWPW